MHAYMVYFANGGHSGVGGRNMADAISKIVPDLQDQIIRCECVPNWSE